MELIDKDALVAEIERRIKYDEMVMNHDAQITELLSRELNTLYELSSFLDTLEVKEVNLEKEIEKELETRWRGEYLYTSKFRESAKHFFELGIQVSNKAQKGEEVWR